MRTFNILLFTSLALFAAYPNSADAASADEAMQWLAGRWTNKNNCTGSWVEFQRQGEVWTYRENEFDGGKPFPATASADASGVVTVKITAPDFGYEYVNTFHDRDTIEAVEGFTSGPMQGRRRTYTYSRCR